MGHFSFDVGICFTNFDPKASQKMADDQTGSVRDVCSRLLSQSIAIDERFFLQYMIN